jgi:hypothetical protein
MNRNEKYTDSQLAMADINELIASIMNMNQVTIFEELESCSEICADLLTNSLISCQLPPPATQLLCYKLIIMIAEDKAMEESPKFQLPDNGMTNFQEVRITMGIRDILYSISEVL